MATVSEVLPSTLKLHSYCRSDIRPLRIHFAWSRRGRLRNYVKQNLTHFARSGSYRVALFILQGINLTAFIQRKNRRLCGHSYTPSPRSYVRTSLIEGTHIAWLWHPLWFECFTAAGQTRLWKHICRGMGWNTM